MKYPYQTKRLFVSDKTVDIFACKKSDCPVVYLNTFQQEGEHVFRTLQAACSPPLSLVAISGLDWGRDMTPWEIPPIFKGDTPCSGGADDYLCILTEKIVPAAEREIGSVLWRGIAGYSLAGLFALYALYCTDIFSRAASVSGSLWYPHFLDYALSHQMKRIPDRLYLSLGDKESKTKNPYLKTVQKNTEELAEFYQRQNIQTVFQRNAGNHYANATERTAAGLLWLLEKQ